MADLHAFVEARLHDDRAYAATNEGGPWKHLDHWVDRQWPMVRRHDGCGDDCITMRCLAEIWKGHPDYDAEWSNT